MNACEVVFIAGPTASGKSAIALELAARFGAEIINADAMQVYADLHILTARPSAADVAAVPHHLYGVLDGRERCSAGKWAQMAADAVRDVHARDAMALLVGGTGLYFRALEDGLSAIPETPAAIREAAAARRTALGPAAFRDEVIARDPAMAALPAGDAQRLQRAWEVFEATGEPLSSYQQRPRQPLISPTAKFVVERDRDALYRNCDARAADMLARGGLDEVAALLKRHLAPDLPVMKALGVPEIRSYIEGDASLDEARAALQQSTRRFAKRQLTWFRNQAADWPRIGDAETIAAAISAA